MARGFNLIEMMIVVGILGVMFALAVPVLTPRVHAAQLDGAAESVASFIARARSDAMTTRRCTRVWIDASGPAPQLVYDRLNNFNCGDDTAAAVAAADWVQQRRLPLSSKNITLTLTVKPNELTSCATKGCVGPAGYPGEEIRFRPNARVWTDVDSTSSSGACTDCDDDAVIEVKHALLSGAKQVLVNSNGLICVYKRGDVLKPDPVGGANNFVCP